MLIFVKIAPLVQESKKEDTQVWTATISELYLLPLEG